MKRRTNSATTISRSPGDIAVVAALSLLLLGGALIVLSAVPASGQSRPADEPIALSAGTAGGTEAQDTFRGRVRDELADWQGKMNAFERRTKANGKLYGEAASSHLRAAWANTEAQGRKVQAATARDWDRAKASYQTASHELALAWDKMKF